MENQTKDKIISLFGRIPIFSSFSANDIKTNIFQRNLARIIEYEPAETIITEGRYDNWVYWLIDGTIDVIKGDCTVARLERVGDMFGEMGILDGEARSASVYAAGKCICLAIDMSILDHPDLKRKISKEAFCRDVAHVTRDRLATTTTRMAAAEHELTEMSRRMLEAEQKYHETLTTLKKTLELIEGKDRELASLREEVQKLSRRPGADE